jgi:hypothetical protein
MKPKFDDLLSTLIALFHCKFDRYDPDWPDLHSLIVADSMLRAFEMLGLADRTKGQAGQTVWRATPELKRLASRIGEIKLPNEAVLGDQEREQGADAADSGLPSDG